MHKKWGNMGHMAADGTRQISDSDLNQDAVVPNNERRDRGVICHVTHDLPTALNFWKPPTTLHALKVEHHGTHGSHWVRQFLGFRPESGCSCAYKY
jgi:hypothetical protein